MLSTPITIPNAEHVVAHQLAISFSISLQHLFNRASGRTFNVGQTNKMQIILIFIIPILVVAFWIYAEVKLRSSVRVISGISAIIAVSWIITAMSLRWPRIESVTHRSSLKLAEELMTNGDTQHVQQALHAYNQVAASNSTCSASFEMWKVLNHGPQQLVPNAEQGRAGLSATAPE